MQKIEPDEFVIFSKMLQPVNVHAIKVFIAIEYPDSTHTLAQRPTLGQRCSLCWANVGFQCSL